MHQTDDLNCLQIMYAQISTYKLYPAVKDTGLENFM